MSELVFGVATLRVRAEIGSHSAAGPQARWRGASDDAYPVRYVRSEQQSQRACGPQPEGARSSACLANENRFMIDHRFSRQNVKLFLREPLDRTICVNRHRVKGFFRSHPGSERRLSRQRPATERT